jgi:hypothetical protein
MQEAMDPVAVNFAEEHLKTGARSSMKVKRN